mmetsp:Transcript_59253/g.130033  ORF Transcript_59253/g.130033 Transcript_59253/m.130033 type:complete len:222 (-) Transcript_59253:266-931(-)
MSFGFAFDSTATAAANCGAHDDDGRFLCLRLGLCHCLLIHSGIMYIPIGNVQHIPALGCEDLCRVFTEGQVGPSIDGDLVVIVENDEFVQLQMSSQRRGLRTYTFHQAAITSQDKGVIVKKRKAFLVEACSQMCFCNRHAYGVGKALPQRTGSHLHSAGHSELWVSRRAAACLAKLLQSLHRYLVGAAQSIACQVEHDVQQRTGMASRKHESVTVYPPLKW